MLVQCVLLSMARSLTALDFLYSHIKKPTGEVYFLNDGGEVDLDLSNYKRHLNVTLSRDNNITYTARLSTRRWVTVVSRAIHFRKFL